MPYIHIQSYTHLLITSLLQENISDFVTKKREMFLVQMSLDVKKAEILKLDARAKDKEEALPGA